MATSMPRVMRTGMLVLLGLMACGKVEAPAAVPAATAGQWPPLVAGYEAVRERLADDDLAGAKTAARKLVDASQEEPALGSKVNALSDAADLEVARRAFGELSRAYLTLLQSKPELGKGLYAFRCPMAVGYQRWVQTDPTLKNPYMGKRMLECGSEVDLAP